MILFLLSSLELILFFAISLLHTTMLRVYAGLHRIGVTHETGRDEATLQVLFVILSSALVHDENWKKQQVV